MTNTTTRPLASTYQADDATRRRNAQRNHAGAVDECFFCGRPLTDAGRRNGFYIHLGTDGTLLEQHDGARFLDPSLSQGCFPVGSECAKTIARPYKFKIGD